MKSGNAVAVGVRAVFLVGLFLLDDLGQDICPICYLWSTCEMWLITGPGGKDHPSLALPRPLRPLTR